MTPERAVERVEADRSSPWWAEHRSRYRFAAAFVEGRRVLDIACGTGYGGAILLGAGAQSVVGVDSSPEAVAEATRRQQPGFEAIRADGLDLPFEDGTFDVVVSFETLEHVEEAERFVAELRRVLADGGVLVLSTPNAVHTSQVGGAPNPFHVREYEPAALGELLRGHAPIGAHVRTGK
jgi:SAM-dependent methyltransferase